METTPDAARPNRFLKFQKAYDEAINTIELFLKDTDNNPPMDGLVRWMLETDANPFSFLPAEWAGCLSTAEGFAELLHHLHHALYDDGDVSFVTVNGEPRIVFASQYDDGFRERVLSEQERRFESKPDCLGRTTLYKIEVLSIVPNDFGPLYDVWYTAWVKKCFLGDSRRNDIEWAAKHYREYQLWDERWVEEARNIQQAYVPPEPRR